MWLNPARPYSARPHHETWVIFREMRPEAAAAPTCTRLNLSIDGSALSSALRRFVYDLPLASRRYIYSQSLDHSPQWGGGSIPAFVHKPSSCMQRNDLWHSATPSKSTRGKTPIVIKSVISRARFRACEPWALQVRSVPHAHKLQ